LSREKWYNKNYSKNNSLEFLMIEKKFIAAGSTSWAIIIPKALLKAMGINPSLDKVGLELEHDGIKLKKLKRKE